MHLRYHELLFYSRVSNPFNWWFSSGLFGKHNYEGMIKMQSDLRYDPNECIMIRFIRNNLEPYPFMIFFSGLRKKLDLLSTKTYNDKSEILNLMNLFKQDDLINESKLKNIVTEYVPNYKRSIKFKSFYSINTSFPNMKRIFASLISNTSYPIEVLFIDRIFTKNYKPDIQRSQFKYFNEHEHKIKEHIIEFINKQLVKTTLFDLSFQKLNNEFDKLERLKTKLFYSYIIDIDNQLISHTCYNGIEINKKNKIKVFKKIENDQFRLYKKSPLYAMNLNDEFPKLIFSKKNHYLN